MSDERGAKSIRIDWIAKFNDEGNGKLSFVMRPNPRRYEWRDGDLYDKLDRILITAEALKQLCEKMEGMPIGFEPQTAGPIDEYVQSRMPEIEAVLRGCGPPPVLSDPSEEFLTTLVGQDHEFAIVQVDVVASSTLAQQDERAYAMLVNVLARELSLLVTKFHGHVLKAGGDGVIAYFAAPSFIVKNDHSVDYALAALILVYRGINAVCAELGLPTLNVRAGVDSGTIPVHAVGHVASKQKPDLVGLVITRACKIQARAPIGTVAIGHHALGLLHTGWRLRCTLLELPSDWPFRDEKGNPYPVWLLNEEA